MKILLPAMKTTCLPAYQENITYFERRKLMKKERKGKIAAGLAVFAALCVSAKFPAPVQTVHAEEVQLPAETNTSFSKARELEFGASMAGKLAESDSRRYYKFSLSQASRLDLGFERSDHFDDVKIAIFDNTQTEIYSITKNYGRSFSLDAVYLTGGDYYLLVDEALNVTFSFIVNMDPAGESFTETQDSNNDMASSASAINLQQKYKGVLAQNDDIDYYKFQVPAAGRITLNLTNAADDSARYAVYDDSLNPVYTNAVSRESKISQPVSVKSGDYYLAVAKYDVNKGTGSYTFSIDYAKKNTVAPKIKSIKNTLGGTMTVKWSQITGASGYELWYSTKSNFKGTVIKKETGASVTSADCYGLTLRKKYYVKVRAYSEINGVKEYGKWSKRKSVVMKS